ncbi:MAG: zinc ribbon domain-containing protein [Anaerolineales bacterium]|nr:zinc ribbon domain-containing protein [Anaerolineales bacterium]
MDLGAVLVGLAMLVVTVVVLADPFVKSSDGGQRAYQSKRGLSARMKKRTGLWALRDLDFDHELGKVSEQDYKVTRAQILQETAAALEEIEKDEAAVEANIEEEVRNLRRTARESGRYCHQCGQAREQDDRFCTACGVEFKMAETLSE